MRKTDSHTSVDPPPDKLKLWREGATEYGYIQRREFHFWNPQFL
jgi:hypothetical protein